ncbi:rhomboid family intramembrane serine protease [Pelagibius litoralis]|uniref:Rhomboid family intramembrane serine protease n=1 Tax=Pelagibius litoralis TaxID=374515 RepID=A0A967EZ82_9PROT|nr:rhomboid family intramembrane serine protease [Pelagibius litoralis]NIA70162.1 rhomboid family intramembrane serine protease [Pelagibius litoralis]
MSPQPDPSYGPPPPPGGRQPMFNLPPGTMWLTLAIIVAFGIENVLQGEAWRWFFANFAFVSSIFWPPGSAWPSVSGMLSLVTHAFLHGDFMHLMLNLGFLLAFGSFVERNVGLIPYLLLFVVCAAAGALTEFAFRGGRELVLIGASGAVYGVTGAAVRFMFAGAGPGAGPGQRKSALSFVLVIMGLNVVLGLSGIGDFLAGAQVGWKAHAGGFVAGLLCALLIGGTRRRVH